MQHNKIVGLARAEQIFQLFKPFTTEPRVNGIKNGNFFVDFLYNVPFKYKYKNKTEKKLLRDAYKGTVIDEVIERKKSPYPKSNSKEYHEEVVKLLREVLEDKSSVLYEIFDINKIEDILNSEEELEVPWYGQLMRKTAFLAYLYQIDYWFKTYKIKLEIE